MVTNAAPSAFNTDRRPHFVRDTAAMHLEMKAFAERLRAGGEPHYDLPKKWAPELLQTSAGISYEPILLVQDGEVRGGYSLKHQSFLVNGTILKIACGPQLPLSEGLVNPRYASVGLLLIKDAMQYQPLLYSLGMGGWEQPFVKVLQGFGWSMMAVPFYFKVLNASSFFENIRYLKSRPGGALAADLLGKSGIGWLGTRLAQMRPPRLGSSVEVYPVDEFGSWADELWERSLGSYSLIAVRNRQTLSALFRSGSRFISLRVARRGRTLGWVALLDTQMSGHEHFGNMRVGSVIDCLAEPEDSTAVVAAATQFLEQRKPDLIVTNQSHAEWGRSFVRNGYLPAPSNFILALSPPLAQKLQPLEQCRSQIHMTRGDGEGPQNINL
jgi:hypothetical protein